MRRALRRSLLAGLRTSLATTLLCLIAGEAAANPTGMQVIAGQVSTVTSGNQLLITNSPGTILNWQSFSIMPGELTRFIQQSAASTVLNRITGQNPSQILGALQSNGKVFLINPNGIIFGAGSRVDVNGLVASSLDMSDADFLAGNLGGTLVGTVSQSPNSYTAPPPTLDQCIANPALPGCSSVLPTLAQCTANSSLAGCSAVLPTLAQCIANSSLAGCSAVLPTLAQCTANSTLAGCSAVLPTSAACTANSSLAGCAAVLPTLTACTANSSLAGCSAVLPTLAQCTVNSSLAGCASSTTTTAQQAAASAPVQQAVSQTVAQVTTASSPTPTPLIVPTPTTSPLPDLPNSIQVDVATLGSGSVSTIIVDPNSINTTGATNPTGGTTNPGVSNDTATKMYCN
jgi:filamentous hemagglutinin family protein